MTQYSKHFLSLFLITFVMLLFTSQANAMSKIGVIHHDDNDIAMHWENGYGNDFDNANPDGEAYHLNGSLSPTNSSPKKPGSYRKIYFKSYDGDSSSNSTTSKYLGTKNIKILKGTSHKSYYLTKALHYELRSGPDPIYLDIFAGEMSCSSEKVTVSDLSLKNFYYSSPLSSDSLNTLEIPANILDGFTYVETQDPNKNKLLMRSVTKDYTSQSSQTGVSNSFCNDYTNYFKFNVKKSALFNATVPTRYYIDLTQSGTNSPSTTSELRNEYNYYGHIKGGAAIGDEGKKVPQQYGFNGSFYNYPDNYETGLLIVDYYPNSAPTVGSPTTKTTGESLSKSFTCNASDPDGDSLTYQWRNVGSDDGNVTLSNNKTINVTAPGRTQAQGVGTYNFQCRAYDGDLYSPWSGSYKIKSNPSPETNAGPDLRIDSDESISITGTINEDGSIEAQQWVNGTGDDGNLILSNTSSTTVNVTAPSVTYPDADKLYNLRFRAKDIYRYGGYNTTVITVNSRPKTNAGSDIRINPGQTKSIVGTANDSNAISAHEWTNHTGDSGDLTISGGDTNEISITVPVDAVNGETYTFKYRAQDDEGLWSHYDYVTVVTNYLPTAVITTSAEDDVANEGDVVTLFGDASYDDEHDPEGVRGIASYKWTQLSGPAATLSDESSASPTFTAPVNEADPFVVFELEVTDLEGAKNTAQIAVRINRTPTLDEFAFPQPFLIHESLGVSDRYANVVNLVNPDDPDLHIDGSTEELSVSWVAVKTNGGDAEISFEYDASDESGSMFITTNDFSEETLFTVTATLTDKKGLFVEKSFNVRANPLPDLTFSALNLVHEQSSNTLEITSVSDNGSVQSIDWRVEKNGVVFTEENYPIDGMSATFTTGNIFERSTVKFIVSVTDNDNGTIEFEKEVFINALPEMELDISLPTTEEGAYFLSGPQLTLISTGDGDTYTNNDSVEDGIHDSDGHVVDIQWELISDNAATVSNDYQQEWVDGSGVPEYTGFKANNADLQQPGEAYIWRVTATDNDGGQDSMTFQIYVNNLPQYDATGSAISLRYNTRGFLGLENLEDVDGEIGSINWIQIAGPTATIADPTSAFTSFMTMASLSGEIDKDFVFRVEVRDDLGSLSYKNVTVTASDVFFGCGDLATDSSNPPGGACHRDSGLNHGVINNNTCNSQVTDLYIPTTLDSAEIRGNLLNECDDRHIYECKKCIPEPLTERYEACQLLPYMMPPKLQAYKVSGGIVSEAESAPVGSNYGEPINTGDWNPDSQYAIWGAANNAEYEAMYLDKEANPASRCLDVTDHIHYLNDDPDSVSFVTPPEADPSSAVTPLDTLPCWSWDLMYRCVEPVVNTCDDWSLASSNPGNLDNVPLGWEKKGSTDVVVDNYLFWLFGPDGPQTKNVIDGVPQDSILYSEHHYIGQERWRIQCRNEETDELNQAISDTFCEKDAEGNVNRLRCNPSFTQDVIDLGAMPLDADGEVIDEATGPFLECTHHNVRPTSNCVFDVVDSMVEALESLEHYELNQQTMLSHSGDYLLAQAMCVEDPNNTGTLVNRIMDDPAQFHSNWETSDTAGPDDCWSWRSRWMFYNGEKFQWCTLTCSDSTTGVKQELVGCGLIDEAAEPIPEWEQWGPGWSQCVEPVIRTLCPADAETTTTINGEEATEDDLAGMDCSEPVGYEERTLTDEVVTSDTVMNCVDYSETQISCIPDPSCELVSVTPTEEEEGIYTQQYQEYVCTKNRSTCEKLVEVEECTLPEDIMFTQDQGTSLEKAIQAMQIVDGIAGRSEFDEGELRIFNGSDIKCKYWTNDAVSLYNIISTVITSVSSYFTGGTGAYLVAAVGGAELMSSQDFLNQQKRCCDKNPVKVAKKVDMQSMLTTAVNNILGSEPQAKVPVCLGQEIRLAHARDMDSHDGHQIKGEKHGFYYEGSAFIKKPFGDLGSYKDVRITHPLKPWEDMTLIKAQEWCVFDNVIARIIQIGARHQLKQLAMASSSDSNFGAQEHSASFSYVGAAADDYGWKLVDSDINGSQMAVYQWSPDCMTPEGHKEAQKGNLKCPYDIQEVYTAYCSSASSCDFSEIQGELADPTDDWDPRRGLVGDWDIVSQYTYDNEPSTLTQFLVKDGVCDEGLETCDWSFYAWPAGGAATSIAFEMSHYAMTDPDAFDVVLEEVDGEPIKGLTTETYTTKKYELRFSQVAYGQPLPETIDVEITDYNSTSPTTTNVTIPSKIEGIDGFDIPSLDLKIYGGCSDVTYGCEWKVMVPVTITAIPDTDCRGLSVDELMIIDFTQIDFSEYEDALLAKVEDTGLDPEQMKALAKQVVSNYADDIKMEAPDSAENSTDIGFFNDVAFVGPQIDMFQFTQTLPYNLGFVDEIDIDWGDGSTDTGVRFNTMMGIWDERKASSINKYYSVCLPALNSYNNERDQAELEKDQAWDEFVECVNEGNSGPVYTTEDLTDEQIAACNSKYDIYDAALEVYNNLSCGVIQDRFNSLSHCVNSAGSNGEPIYVVESDVSSSISSAQGCSAEHDIYTTAVEEHTPGACGETATNESLSHTGCASNMLSMIDGHESYKKHFEDMLASGEALIEMEHLWPSYSDDREHRVEVTAKTYAVKGDPDSGIVKSQVFFGNVLNFSEELKHTNGAGHVQASQSGPVSIKGESPKINNQLDESTVLDGSQDGAIDKLIEDTSS